MPYADLRQFLERLEAEGQLVRVKEPVQAEPDLSSIGRAAANLEQAPAVLVENIKGYYQKVALNVHGSWANHALMFELPKDMPVKEQFMEISRRWDNFPVPVRRVSSSPVKEIKHHEQINLFELMPLFRVNKFDGGFYLSKAAVVSRDPEDQDNFHKQNVGIYRIQVKGKDLLGIQVLPFHDIAIHLRKAEERNQPLPVAIAVGNDPVLTFVASTPMAYEESEYEMAGALRGEPFEVIKAETSNLDVPAGAELILEGEILPRRRSPEGPFGEFPGSYSGVRMQAEVKIHTVTHRVDPIFENLYLGVPWTEIDYLQALNTSIPLYKQIKASMPEVVAVNAMYTHGIGVIISTNCRFGGYGKAVAIRLLSTPHGMPYSKIIIVVDDFVDPFNLEQVMWALTTKVRPDKDVILIHNAPGMPLDPSSDPPGMHTKLIIDATTPVPPDVVSREVELVDTPAKTALWEKILKELHRNKKGGSM
ncbi:phenolic acid decarboxylase subunit C [Moorella thermoacetica]|uniref:non-oxidative hydroxyarylic acid decarboxylases subunit C n=1 Tax=Neomoorella thermoacetica TaxID=1525 RepID=UPI00069F6670|nr:non-oxidative hydroxyarylic acid decarboxylases subunit C [Moorella thermoacetica]AKX93124.1 phenolic acid decarboxylase subunit C [Moorella thermoacetica]